MQRNELPPDVIKMNQGIDGVRKAVAQAEKITSAEIVTYIMRQASDYHDAFWKGGLCGMISAVLCVALSMAVWPRLLNPIEFILGGMMGCLIGLTATSIIPEFTRMLVPQWRMHECVLQKAKTRFHELGIDETSGRTGILLVVSGFEREVIVYADRAICEAYPDWTPVTDIVRRDLMDKNLLSGIAKGIAMIGILLKDLFPVQPGDINELPDAVFTDRESTPVSMSE